MLNGTHSDGDLPEHVMLPVFKTGDNMSKTLKSVTSVACLLFPRVMMA